MTPHFRLNVLILGFVLTAAVLTGCGSEERISSPDLSQTPYLISDKQVAWPHARGFFPLEAGSRWHYLRTFQFEIEYLNSPTPAPGDVYEAAVERSMIGRERISGLEYAVEEVVIWIPDGNPPVKRWTRFREDHAGLYVADVPVNQPPGAAAATSSNGHGAAVEGSIADMMIPGWDRVAFGIDETVAELTRSAWHRHRRSLSEIHAMLEPGGTGGGGKPAMEMMGRPGGPFPGELLWLPYPPHPGATWIQRLAPFRIVSEVEAHESLDLPAGRFPACRVRIENSLLGDNDSVVVWFGRCGRLRFDIHKETVALDIDSGEMVRISSDEVEVLTRIDLAEPGRCGGGSGASE